MKYTTPLRLALILFLALTATTQAANAVSVSVTTFKGAWTSGKTYSPGQVVTFQGASYITPVTTKAAPNAANTPWLILAAQGVPGPQGQPGTNGTNGINGTNGAPGPAPVYPYRLTVGQSPASDDGTGRTLASPDYTSITTALAAITPTFDSNGACTNHWLVKVLPGVYTEQVTMKPCVDIEGSGELTTRITFGGGTEISQVAATVVGADQSELRSISVESSGGAYDIAFYVSAGASARVTQVTLSASGPTAYGFYADSANPLLKSVTIISNGYGGFIIRGNVTLRESQISASGIGVQILRANFVLADSTVSGGTLSIMATQSSTITVTNTKLDGTESSDTASTVKIANSNLNGNRNSGGVIICVGVYDGNFMPLDASCR